MFKKGELTFISILCLVLIFAGCSAFKNAPVEKQVLMSYDIMTSTLNTAKTILTTRRNNGTMNEKDYQEAKSAFNSAVDIHNILGNTALLVIDNGQGEIYNSLALELMNLLTVIDNIINKGDSS